MTTQEAFNKVWNHFIVDQQPLGRTPIEHCNFRTPNGYKCAIGVLIPDEEYRSEFENIEGLTKLQAEVPSLHNLHIGFLNDLMHAHDSSLNHTSLKVHLENLACEFNLSIPQ